MSLDKPESTDVSKMLRAASHGDTATVESLLQRGLNVNVVGRLGDQDGETIAQTTALILATQHGRLEVISLLLANGADANFRTEDADTALLTAAHLGHAEAIRMILESGADLYMLSQHGSRSALHEAVSESLPTNIEGKLRVIDLLLDNGMDVNDADEDERTALHLASRTRSLALATKLVSKGAKIDARNIWGDTPLDDAAICGSREIVQLLISHGAPVNSPDNGCTGLRHAVAKGYLDVVAFLLDNGANAPFSAAHDPELLCAARLAVSDGNSDMIKLLCDHGFDTQGPNALFRAALLDPPTVIQKLVDIGVSVHIKDKKARSALHLAVLGKRFEKRHAYGVHNPKVEVIKYFIERGVDSSLKDAEGKTAEDLAFEMQFLEAINLLRWKKSD